MSYLFEPKIVWGLSSVYVSSVILLPLIFSAFFLFFNQETIKGICKKLVNYLFTLTNPTKK